MTDNIQEQEIRYSIVNIKQILFSANESLMTKPKETILSSLNAKMGFMLEHNVMNFTLRAWYHYNDENVELAFTEVENVFYVENIARFVNANNELDFPAYLWVNIVGLSISHTRALFTKSLAGTAFQNNIISIMNPYETAKHFFPKSFEIPTQILSPQVKKRKARATQKK